MKRALLITSLSLVFFGIFLYWAQAQEFISNNFKVLDPVLQSGNYSSSESGTYRLNGVISQISIGTSTATSFGLNAGFLYFPYVSTPTVTATAGNAQVSLSWTPSEGFLGWTVGGYGVGKATASGGPYSYTTPGVVTSYVSSNLTNDTTYYFVVRVRDIFGNYIATSTQVSATPTAPPAVCGNATCNTGETCSTCPADCGVCPSGGGGGGGGGGIIVSATIVKFSGRAYPGSTVTILKDGQLLSTTVSGPDAIFSIEHTNVTPGSYIYTLYAEDNKKNRSIPFTFPITIVKDSTTTISGIFMAPTLDVNKTSVKRGDNIVFFGQSAPSSSIIIQVNSDTELFLNTKSDKDGGYIYTFDTSQIDLGDHFAKSKAALLNEVTMFGRSVGFKVGQISLPKGQTTCPIKGDVNNDCRVNLVDFSIAAFWYKRVLTDTAKANIDAKLYPDGKIDLRDFSIMAYYWTG